MGPARPHPTRPHATCLAALGLALALGAMPARAEEGPPKLDVETTCKSSGRVQVGLSEKESQDGCLRSERAAHDELKKRWGEFSPDAKAQCSKQSQAGGYPSYVETVTCLELATGTVPAQTGPDRTATTGPGAPAATGAAGRSNRGSDLTAEPSPQQRTNPIQVLDNKP